MSSDSVLLALGITFVAGVSTSLGALIAFCVRKKDFKKIDIEGFESMSFEERMKVYKEKYGVSKTSASGKKYSQNRRDGKKYSSSKKYNGKSPVSKAVAKPVQKKGLLAKIKAFFGR